MKRWRVVALVAVALGAGAFAPIARADGDPASDYLVGRQVFLSSLSTVASPAQRDLLATVQAANRGGFAVRVAIISSDYDLGSITALWRKPSIYARFLGLELSSTFKGRLLVVMPNGFGFNWPSHLAGRAYGLLQRVPIKPDGAGLLTAAQTAVRRLAAADGIAVRPVQPGTAGTVTAPARGSNVVPIMVAGAAMLAALGGLFLVLARRRSHRLVRARGRPSVRAGDGRHPTWRRWALPGFAILCGLAVGVPIVLLTSLRHRGVPSSTQVSSLVSPPPFSWPAGRRSAPEFVLHDQNGRPVSIAAYRGRPVIVTFIDPLCRNLCPLEAKVLNDVVARMPASERPEILAVSVDVYANADRRANLLQDVRKWELVPQWRWAVGRPAQLAAVWKHYEIGVLVTTKRIAGATINYITHTEAAYIVDATGHERALFLWPFYPQDVQRTLHQLS